MKLGLLLACTILSVRRSEGGGGLSALEKIALEPFIKFANYKILKETKDPATQAITSTTVILHTNQIIALAKTPQPNVPGESSRSYALAQRPQFDAVATAIDLRIEFQEANDGKIKTAISQNRIAIVDASFTLVLDPNHGKKTPTSPNGITLKIADFQQLGKELTIALTQKVAAVFLNNDFKYSPHRIQTLFDSNSVAFLDLQKAVAFKPDTSKYCFIATRANLDRVYNAFFNKERIFVPEYYRDWDESWPTYNPTDWVAPFVKANEFDWADKEDVTLYKDHFFRNTNGINRTSLIRRYPQDSNGYYLREGYPKNPQGRTGFKNRGVLGKWGPNPAVDAFIVRYICKPKNGEEVDPQLEQENRKSLKCYEVIVLARAPGANEQETCYATVGGMVDNGENHPKAIMREIMEEIFVDMDEELADYEKEEIPNIQELIKLWESLYEYNAGAWKPRAGPPVSQTLLTQDELNTLDARLLILHKLHKCRVLATKAGVEGSKKQDFTAQEKIPYDGARSHRGLWEIQFPEFLSIFKRTKKITELEKDTAQNASEIEILKTILDGSKKNLVSNLKDHKVANRIFATELNALTPTILQAWMDEMEIRLEDVTVENGRTQRIEVTAHEFRKLIGGLEMIKYLYLGQCDDYRNTDEAWMETIAYLIMCDEALEKFIEKNRAKLPSLESAEVRWLKLEDYMNMTFFASHKVFFKTFEKHVIAGNLHKLDDAKDNFLKALNTA